MTSDSIMHKLFRDHFASLVLHVKLLVFRLASHRGQTLEARMLLYSRIIRESGPLSNLQSDIASMHLRGIIQSLTHRKRFLAAASLENLLAELSFILANAETLRPVLLSIQNKRVLFCGQAYYNSWYLSRALRRIGWKADLLDWDENQASKLYYHGSDFCFTPPGRKTGLRYFYNLRILRFYISALFHYDIFHFANAHGICFGYRLSRIISSIIPSGDEIRLIRLLGKSIVYSNNGCLDGVSQTSFSQWGPESVCLICPWQDVPSVCNDDRNLTFGKFRNEVADFQCLIGGNRADYNISPLVHEVPEFYCLSPRVWSPVLRVPRAYQRTAAVDSPSGSVTLYHSVGNLEERTNEDGVNIKSSHVYLPLIDRLKAEGISLNLLTPSGVPNKKIRFFQAQADIFLEMLTYGWFGANAREAMMLAKPVICFIRPEWLESVRNEIPEYADELPIVRATPETVEDVLRQLIGDPALRNEIGMRSRQFALKWHSDTVASRRFDAIYTSLLLAKRLKFGGPA